jgi:hypothetical protein
MGSGSGSSSHGSSYPGAGYAGGPGPEAQTS